MFVKPGPRLDDPSQQLLVRKPNKQFLSPSGENVSDDDLYWHKMLLEGDVVVAEPPNEQPTAERSDA